MSDGPFVSVIIPTYNNSMLVVEAVESVFAQTYKPVELVVVDDGSTDDTAERLRAYEGRLTLIRQVHRGPAVARNAGIRASKGAIVAFLDSDDVWKPAKLERCAGELVGNADVGVVYTGVRVLDLTTQQEQYAPCYDISGMISREMFLECRGVNLSAITTWRRCLDEIGLFDEELFRAQDWDLFIRLAERYAYGFVPEVLTIRRVHAGGLSVVRRDLYRGYNLRVIQKAAQRRPDLYAPLVNEALSRAHFRFGMHGYAEFDMRSARQDFLRSLRLKLNWNALNYFLRTFLPVKLVARLRKMKQARRSATQNG